MVKVLVVDDSAFVRRTLTSLLEADKDIQVIGTASNGVDALIKAAQLDPDVITMDINMPVMNGLDALEHIMRENPCPVIMVSSLNSASADATLKALELGALDFIAKFTASALLSDMKHLEMDLAGKVKALARRKAFLRMMFSKKQAHSAPLKSRGLRDTAELTHGKAPDQPPERVMSAYCRPFEVISIGVSTGGPHAVQKILAALPVDLPAPILIAQHMPAPFTGPFASRLNAQCKISVKEAEPVERLEAGTVYICPGGKHLRLENYGGMLVALVTEEPKEALYKPSVNVLMESSAIASGCRTLGIILTGMGNDGVKGVRELKNRGGWVIAQNEASCVVYGMPKAVVDAGLADEIVDIADMANVILSHFSM